MVAGVYVRVLTRVLGRMLRSTRAARGLESPVDWAGRREADTAIETRAAARSGVVKWLRRRRRELIMIAGLGTGSEEDATRGRVATAVA
jgi:hypothetical protein